MENLIIRTVQKEELDLVAELENKIWPEGTRASKEMFESRFNLFPQGFFVVYKGSEIIGVSTSEIINYSPKNPPSSWEGITDNGWIKKNHNPQGNALYVVSVGAVSRSGGGSALVQAQKELAKQLNLEYLILGARIPGYAAYCKEHQDILIQEYVKLTKSITEGKTELLDSELRFYTRNGLILESIKPNYMEDDAESRNYGAIMVWKNPNYKK